MATVTKTDSMIILHEFLPKDLCAGLKLAFDKNASNPNLCRPGVSGRGEVQEQVKKSMDIWLGRDLSKQPDLLELRNELMPLINEAFAEYFVRYPALYWDNAREALGKSLGDYGKDFYLSRMHDVFTIQPCQLQKYTVNDGGYPAWHAEWSPNGGNKRVLTYMFYVNDVEEDGCTLFLNQGIATPPKAGTLVIFPAYGTHVHKGCKATSNDKYIGTSWVIAK